MFDWLSAKPCSAETNLSRVKFSCVKYCLVCRWNVINMEIVIKTLLIMTYMLLPTSAEDELVFAQVVCDFRFS